MIVSDETRDPTMANHTATHLLHEALRHVLGDHVKQAGSSVRPDGFRFDFTHFEALNADQLREIEARVNANIRRNAALVTTEMSMDKAQESGAIALFEERYGEVVRVVEIQGISKELCGGTHVSATGRIGFFKIVSEESVAAGVRRIEARTGGTAVAHVQAMEQRQQALVDLIRTRPEDLVERVERLQADLKTREKEIEGLKARLAGAASADLLGGIREVAGVPLLTRQVELENPKELRQMGDKIRDRLESGVVLLGAASGGKAILLALVSEDLQDRFPAGEVVKAAAQAVGGGGGGRKDMAQAGGSDPSKLEEAFQAVENLVKNKG